MSLDLFWLENQASVSTHKRESDRTDGIDVPRTGDSTWSLRDSKQWFIYLCYLYAYELKSHLDLSRLDLKCDVIQKHQPLLRHPTSYYVTLRHANLEYRVIANHRLASGLRLAPHLTHAPSGQLDDRRAGDITPPLGGWPTTAKLAVAQVSGAFILPTLIGGAHGLKGSKAFPDVGTRETVMAGMLLNGAGVDLGLDLPHPSL